MSINGVMMMVCSHYSNEWNFGSNPGGAVGLTENPSAFRRWMVVGPEQIRLLSEFEDQFDIDAKEERPFSQHEQGLSTQETFKQQVNNLTATIKNMGNPFLDDCPELLALDSRNCFSENVISTVSKVEAIGTAKYREYVQNVIVERTVPIHQSIKRNSLTLLKQPQSKTNKAKGRPGYESGR